MRCAEFWLNSTSKRRWPALSRRYYASLLCSTMTVGAVLFTAVLGVLRYEPWKQGGAREIAARQQLTVGSCR